MYIRNDASKMEIQYNSRQETEMPGTSDFKLGPDSYLDNLFEEEYLVTGNEADNHNLFKFFHRSVGITRDMPSFFL